LVVNQGEVIEVAAHPVEHVVDTTAAGDLYAAGFLYGFTTDRSLERCGRLGSVAASAVLGHTGARPGLSLAQLADSLDL
jgi:sugar/nucleoside kinase (ribokinase family)